MSFSCSDLFYLWSNDGLVVFFDLFFTLLQKVFLALMILWESVVFAVGAVTFVTLEAEESYFFVADETFGVVWLFGRDWWLWVFQSIDFFHDLFALQVLPKSISNYL